MALDRFIYWQDKSKTPNIEELHPVLEDFFNGAGEVTWVSDRLIIDLLGASCFPHRIFLDGHMVNPVEAPRNERFIEVFVGEDNVDVITREADPYTNAIAVGIVKMISVLWQGKTE